MTWFSVSFVTQTLSLAAGKVLPRRAECRESLLSPHHSLPAPSSEPQQRRDTVMHTCPHDGWDERPPPAPAEVCSHLNCRSGCAHPCSAFTPRCCEPPVHRPGGLHLRVWTFCLYLLQGTAEPQRGTILFARFMSPPTEPLPVPGGGPPAESLRQTHTEFRWDASAASARKAAARSPADDLSPSPQQPMYPPELQLPARAAALIQQNIHVCSLYCTCRGKMGVYWVFFFFYHFTLERAPKIRLLSPPVCKNSLLHSHVPPP